MAEIPHYWRAYAHLQQRAQQSRRMDAISWSVEAGLDHLLDSPRDDPERVNGLARAVSTSRRREAYRRGVLRRLADEKDCPCHPEAAFHAAMQLKTLRSRLAPQEWDVLCDVGAGQSYDEIAAARGGTAGGHRIRVLRLRRVLARGEARDAAAG